MYQTTVWYNENTMLYVTCLNFFKVLLSKQVSVGPFSSPLLWGTKQSWMGEGYALDPSPRRCLPGPG